VADATRDKIKDHARAIGYIYNRRAASLRTSRSGIVGVVVHDIMNPFFAEILRSIESELDRAGKPSSSPTTTTSSRSSAPSSTRCCSLAPTG
jgi:DNA-binding LacI/PurR family transcriptional regulator